MGFRSRRRHRGNGQAGQGHQGGGGHYQGGGDPNGLQPGDDVGNRKNFKVLQLPPEDIGNRKDPEEAEWVPEDDVGNRVDANPTHEISGILMDLDGKRRRRRPKGVAAPERVGRYLVGGVNPLVSGGAVLRPVAPPPPVDDAADADERGDDERSESAERVERAERPERSERQREPHGNRSEQRQDRGRDDGRSDSRAEQRGDNRSDHRGDSNGAPRTRRGHLDSVDPVAATQINDKRAQRFFDFEEDDRFEYTLKTSAEDKRKDAEVCVQTILREAGRNASAVSRLIEDGDRPKLLVTIDDRGASPELMPERRADNAKEPLFVMGSAALLSLNYLVNKIVNRYPNDRIRLAILPAGDERLYLDALEEHVQKKRPGMVVIPGSARAAPVSPAPVAPAPVTLAPQPAAPAPVTMLPTAAEAPAAPAPAAAVTGVADEPDLDAPPKKAAKKVAAKKAEPAAADKADDEDEAPKKATKKAAAKKSDDDEAPKKATKKVAAKKAEADDEDDEADEDDDAPKKKVAKKVAKKKVAAKKK